jgi:hypothetical protein
MLVAEIASVRVMGKSGQHAKLGLTVNNQTLEAVWFNANRIPNAGETHHFVLTLGENNFRGKTTLQAMVQAGVVV